MGKIFVITLFLLSLPGLAQQRPLSFTDMFEMGRVSDPQISPDGRWVAYGITYYNVAGNNRNADLYLVSTDGKVHKQLTFHPATDASPLWSADSKQLAFISTRDGSAQIYRLHLDGGEAQPVSDIATGVNAFTWSADGKYFAVATDMYPDAATPAASAKQEKEKAKDQASGRVIDALMYRHWNAWKEGKNSRVVVVPAAGGEAVSVTPAGSDCPPISLGSSHDFDWSPDGNTICFVQNPDPVVAASTNNDLWLTDRSGKAPKQVTTGRGNDCAPGFSPDGKYLAYLSMSREGFEADQQNLMIYDLASGETRNLTASLDRSVSDFAWSPDSRKLYFYVPHHGRSRLFEVDRNGSKPKLLLDKKDIGALAVHPDGKSLVLNIQAANMPYELFRFDIAKKQLTQLTFTNRERLAQLEMNPVEDYWFTGANGDSVHLLMVKPPKFDPAKKYPLVHLIHGGPQGAFSDDFHYRWNSELFAAPGYVVIMVNFHGSRGYGQDFCDAVSKNWGGAPFEDVMTGTRWAISNFDFIDGERVGAAGASYGGFMINWIAGHNDDNLFKVLVSHDGVYEQVSMFGATEELWFPMWEFNGKPWEEGSLYQKWNPANHAAKFRTPMLVIHGEHDYRVPYTQGLQLFTALQMNGVDSRLLFFPDEDHFVRKPQNARLWWQTVHGWLGKYLQP